MIDWRFGGFTVAVDLISFHGSLPPGVIEKETFWLESPSFMTVVWLLIIICFGLFGLYLILLDFYFFCFFWWAWLLFWR